VRLAYIIENYGEISETFISNLIDGLSKDIKQIFVISDKNKTDHDIQVSPNVSLIECDYVSKNSTFIAFLIKVRKLLNFKPFDIKLKKINSKRCLLDHLIDIKPTVAYVEYGNNATLAYESLNILKIPFIVHFHGRDATELFQYDDYKNEIANVFDSAKFILTPSTYIKNRLLLAGCPQVKLKVVFNGINIDLFNSIIENEIIKKTKYPSIIHVGRLVEKKNPIALVEAFRLVLKEFDNARLTIIGDGPLKHDMIHYIKKMNILDSITICGSMSYDDVLRKLYTNWIYAQHSVTSSSGDEEGMPVSIMEAMAFGLPVVSTRHSGIPEQVINQRTGFLVDQYDFEGMSKSIIKLISDSKLREKMGESGMKRVKNKFLLSSRVEMIQSILHQIETN